jgi:hypothetical protein
MQWTVAHPSDDVALQEAKEAQVAAVYTTTEARWTSSGVYCGGVNSCKLLCNFLNSIGMHME